MSPLQPARPGPARAANSGPAITTVNHRRVNAWFALLMAVCAVFVVRLFYLQVLRHDFYQKAALSGQLHQYDIPAERGEITAHDGDQAVPLVLNERRFTVIADPKTTKDHQKVAAQIAAITGGNEGEMLKQLQVPGSRYAVLAKKLPRQQKDKVVALNISGVVIEDSSVRVYPEGQLAAQLLGFVDDEGLGKYGLEQSLDSTLAGIPGKLKAITDLRGIPLLNNKDNVLTDPKPGKKVLLTIDIGMQRQLEDILKSGLDAAKSKSGSALIIDPNTGAIKAMANWPSYNPAEFYKTSDASLFTNAAVASPLEVGSSMKVLTMAAALDSGSVGISQSYYDPSYVKVADRTITNIAEDGGASTRTIADILTYSLNTGAVYLLKQMGGGEINDKARHTWHDYLTAHYMFGKQTGVEQGYESPGVIPDADKGFGLQVQYATMAFGQGLTTTPLQLGAALAGVVNGGTYYKPHMVEAVQDGNGTKKVISPTVVKEHVVSQAVSKDIRSMMETVVLYNNKPALRDGYSVGGKTGTAQVPKPGGGYYDDRYNGTYIGFVGGDKPQYVIVVRVNEPGIPGYAGAKAAAPVFANLANMLMNNFSVAPKS